MWIVIGFPEKPSHLEIQGWPQPTPKNDHILIVNLKDELWLVSHKTRHICSNMVEINHDANLGFNFLEWLIYSKPLVLWFVFHKSRHNLKGDPRIEMWCLLSIFIHFYSGIYFSHFYLRAKEPGWWSWGTCESGRTFPVGSDPIRFGGVDGGCGAWCGEQWLYNNDYLNTMPSISFSVDVQIMAINRWKNNICMIWFDYDCKSTCHTTGHHRLINCMKTVIIVLMHNM